MAELGFDVAVAGDSGSDIFTEYVEAYESDDHRIQRPNAAYDVHVPSGAAFTALAFHTIFKPNNEFGVNPVYVDLCDVAAPRKSKHGFSTLQTWLVELSRFKIDPSKNPTVLRILHMHPLIDHYYQHIQNDFSQLDNFNTRRITDFTNPPASQTYHNYDLLVLHHGAGSWKSSVSETKGAENELKMVQDVLSNIKESHVPRIIINLNNDLPDVEHNSSGDLKFAESCPIWRLLFEPENLSKVCVICSVNMLRKEGASISRRLSFEQTVEDIATDLLLFEKFKILSSFKHLIVRLSMVGAVHILTEGRKRSADLVFAPLAKSGVYRDPSEDGIILGQNTLLAAALTNLFSKKLPCKRLDFVNAMKSGLIACMRAFD